MSLSQFLTLRLDPNNEAKLMSDFRAAADKGVTALRREFESKMATNRLNLADGFINEREFRAANARVAEGLKQTIIPRMLELQRAGQETGKEYTQLGNLLKKASSEGAGAAGVLSKAWSGLKSTVGTLGAAIGVAFGVRALIDFGKASVQTALDVGKSWASIGNAVKTVGGDFVKLRPLIEGTVERISKSLAFDDEEIRDGLTRFIRATGSVDQGLRGIEVAAKLARAGGMSVQQATDLLTRALETGNVRGLTPFVGNLKGTKDVLGDVNAALGNVAATVSPFQRGTMALSETWEDLKVAIGNVLISGAEGANVFDMLTTGIEQFTKFIVANKDEIGRWIAGGLKVAGEVMRFFLRTVFDTASQISDLVDTMARVDVAMRTSWNRMVTSVVMSIQSLLGGILKVQEGMLALAEALPGDPMAEQIRRAMGRTSQIIGELGTFIAQKSAETTALQAEHQKRLADRQAAESKRGADAAVDSITAAADATVIQTERMGASHATAAEKALAAWNTGFLSGFQESMDSQVAAANEAGEQITADLNRYLAEQRKAEQDANTARIQGYVTTTSRFAALSDESLRLELERLKTIASDTTRSEADRRKAFDETAAIYAELEERKRQQTKETFTASQEAAEETKRTWLDSMHILSEALDDLGARIGGVLGSFISGLGNVVSGVTAAGAGIKAFSEVSGSGILSVIQKVSALAGGFGGVVSAAIAVLPVVKSIGKAIGDLLGIGGPSGTITQGREQISGVEKGAKAGDAKSINFLQAAILDPRLAFVERAKKGLNEKDLYHLWLSSIQAYNRVFGQGAGEKYIRSHGSGTYGYQQVNMHEGGVVGRGGRPDNRMVDWSGAPRLHGGGWLRPNERPIIGQVGEIVMPNSALRSWDTATRALAGYMEARSPGSVSNADNRSMTAVVNIYGVMDKDVPRRVVDAIDAEFARRYQQYAMLQGNATLPR